MYYRTKDEIQFYEEEEGANLRYYAENERTGERWQLTEALCDFLCRLDGLEDYRAFLNDRDDEFVDTVMQTLLDEGIIEKRKRIRWERSYIEITLLTLDRVRRSRLTNAVSTLILLMGLPAIAMFFYLLFHPPFPIVPSSSRLPYLIPFPFLILCSSVAHELSHAVTCISAGKKCYEIQLVIPLHGAAVMEDHEGFGRLQRAAIASAGIMGETVFVLMLIFALRPFYQLHYLLFLYMIFHLTIIFENMIPSYSLTAGCLNDGSTILECLMGVDDLDDRLRELFRSNEARQKLLVAKPKNPLMIASGILILGNVLQFLPLLPILALALLSL